MSTAPSNRTPNPAPSSPNGARAQARRRRRFATLLVVAGVLVIAMVATIGIVLAADPATAPEALETPTPTPEPTRAVPSSTATPIPVFDMTKHSLTDPDSPWVIVNKLNPMNPQDFEPEVVPVPVPYVNPAYMRKAPADAVVKMFADFTAETGLEMQVLSSYRSYSAQQQVYGGNDTLTARPGFSEHQTGWVVDIDALPRTCSMQACFRDTPQGKWLSKNAWKYGFILRYPDGLTKITGYQFEPWHFRYVGVELAEEMRTQGIKTLEEFFGYPAAPNYR